MRFPNNYQKIAHVIDHLNEFIGKRVAWSAFFIVLITFFIVILRYGFNWNSIAWQESVVYFHAILFMLGAAYTLKQDGHVRVDIFYSQFSNKAKALVNISGTLFFLIPLCLFILFSSSAYVFDAWVNLEGSRETGGLPLLYLLKSVIPLMAILLLLQAIANLLKSIAVLSSSLSSKNKPEIV